LFVLFRGLGGQNRDRIAGREGLGKRLVQWRGDPFLFGAEVGWHIQFLLLFRQGTSPLTKTDTLRKFRREKSASGTAAERAELVSGYCATTGPYFLCGAAYRIMKPWRHSAAGVCSSTASYVWRNDGGRSPEPSVFGESVDLRLRRHAGLHGAGLCVGLGGAVEG